MTSDSRTEAVARAIYAAGRGEFGIRPDHPSERARRIFEQVWQAGGTTDDQRDDIKLCYLQAQAAIEANDKWLAVKWTCPNCEAKHNQDAKDCWLCQTKREPNQ